jgi:hypothetical protein
VVHDAHLELVLTPRIPTVGSLADCARAASDQTVAPPTANMSARRLTHAPKLKFTHFPERISRLDPGSDTRSRSVRELDR